MVRKVITFFLFLTLFTIAASPSQQGVGSYPVYFPILVSSDYTVNLATRSEQVRPARDYAGSYIGGTRWDFPEGIAADGKGDLYIAGITYSADFPVTSSAFDLTCGFDGDCDYGRYGHQADIFVVKISGKTRQIVYATYLGGSRDDFLSDMTVDEKGSVYLTGHSYSMDFPTTPGAYNPDGTYGAPFVVKLSPQGSHLEYATHLHSSMGTSRGISLDKQGSAFVIGSASSEGFPTTAGSYQPGFPFDWGVYVIQLNATGTGLVYATLIPDGGGVDIQVDRHGNAYITGTSSSARFPTTPGAFNTSLNDDYGDIFVSKLSAGGRSLLYSTFLGGTSDEMPVALDISQQGEVVVVGGTNSTDFPVTAGAFQQQADTIFIAQLNAQGTGLNFATYLGGSGQDYPQAVQINPKGEVFVSGCTGSFDFPVTDDALDPTCGTDGQCNPSEIFFPTYDGFLSRFTADGTHLTNSTFLGGSGEECVHRLAMGQSGTLYFAGGTSSPDILVTPGMFDLTYNGDGDVFTGWLRIK